MKANRYYYGRCYCHLFHVRDFGALSDPQQNNVWFSPPVLISCEGCLGNESWKHDAEGVPFGLGGVKNQHSHCSGLSCCYGMGLITGRGLPRAPGSGQKKKKKKKKKKKRKEKKKQTQNTPMLLRESQAPKPTHCPIPFT